MYKSSKARIIALLAVLGLLVGCSGGGKNDEDRPPQTGLASDIENLPTDGPAEDGGSLRITETADAITLDPHKSASFSVHTAVAGAVYSKLLDFKRGRDIPYGGMELEGDLAESWSSSDDAKTWTFKLRKGVKFQNVAPVNGREFTAADVVCTIDRIKTLPGVQLNLVEIVSEVKTPDQYTVQFELSSPYVAFDESMASFFMEILPCEGTRGEFDLANKAIGTGPFILQDWKRKQSKLYVKNPNYFIPGKPHLDSFEVLQIADPAAQLAGYRAGELGITSLQEQAYTAFRSSNPEAVIRSNQGLSPTLMFFNQEVEPFDDYRVRKAMAMAWDRNAMAESLFEDYSLMGAYPSSLFGALTPEEADKAYPYDVEAAKKLLADAGFPNGFEIEMITTDGYGPSVVNQAQWVQEDLKKIGITTTLRVMDYASYFATWSAKDYKMAYGLLTAFLSPDEWLQAVYKSDGPRNWWNVKDATLDKMIEEQRAITDKDAREKKLHEINEYIAEKVANPVFGMTYSSLTIQAPWVHNYYAHPAYERGHFADVWVDSNAPSKKK